MTVDELPTDAIRHLEEVLYHQRNNPFLRDLWNRMERARTIEDKRAVAQATLDLVGVFWESLDTFTGRAMAERN